MSVFSGDGATGVVGKVFKLDNEGKEGSLGISGGSSLGALLVC